MKNKFNLELDLVKAFQSNFKKLENEIVILEMPIRHGNIDVVSIKNFDLPFSNKQITALSKPSSALVFTRIKNKRPISKEKLSVSIGLSQSTLNNTLYELLDCELIYKENDNYYRAMKFEFPKTVVTGYEAKLKDFNKAFYQAKSNKDYIDYSYLVFPMDMAKNVFKKRINLLQENGIGLIGVSEIKSEQLLRATKSKRMRGYIRLLNLAKANKIVSKGLLN